MSTTAEEGTLQESLGKLETSLLSPVVAGELIDWVEVVRDSAAETQRSLEAYINDVLHARYAEIARSDNELLFRVQQAKDEDQKLVEELQAFRRELDELAQQAPAAQKDELRVEERRRHIEERGTRFILAVRKHQLAVSDWLNESFFRDRGPGD